MKGFGYFSISSKHVEALGKILSFKEMDRDGLLRHMPTRLLLMLAIEKMLKCLTVQLYFPSVEEACPSLIWRMRMRMEKMIIVKQKLYVVSPELFDDLVK